MRKIYSLLLILLMAVMSVNAANVVDSGTFEGGGNWTFYSDGTLNIDAQKVPDYTFSGNKTDAPWANRQVKNVGFSGQIRYIGRNSFRGMYDLRTVTFGTNSGTVKICENAFLGTSVNDFDFSYVGEIEDQAFTGTLLPRVVLPKINSIKGAPFTDCMYLERSNPLDATRLRFNPSIIITSTSSLNITGAIAKYTDSGIGTRTVIMSRYDCMDAQWTSSEILGVRSYNTLVFGAFEDNGEQMWYVDANDRMIFDCAGADMKAYSVTINSSSSITSDARPWKDALTKIKELHIYRNDGKKISSYAFFGFSNLEKVEFHSATGTIDDSAFRKCAKLTTVDLSEIATINQNAFNSSALTAANLTACKKVGDFAFAYNKLTSVVLGPDLANIGTSAFAYAIKDNGDITAKRSTPPTLGSNVFEGVNQNKVWLWYDESFASAYNKSPWNQFKHTADANPIYGVYNGTTLTIYYDNQIASRNGVAEWWWEAERRNVTKVVFDASMENARPSSTKNWFYDFENLTSFANISYLHTDRVTTMYSMFDGCKKLTAVKLDHFKTSNVTDFGHMFAGCEALTALDLNSFDMSSATTTSMMFSNCQNLQRINCEKDWTQYSSTIILPGSMFEGCNNLKGGRGTLFDSSKKALEYARPDGGPDAPGYFWRATDTGSTQDVENVQSDNVQSTKVLRNGQFYIIRDGKIYNVQGVEIK